MNTKQWQAYSFLFQMGSLGSEISRATMFKEQYNERRRQSFEIALDLLDLTIKDPKNVGRLAELCRLRGDYNKELEMLEIYHVFMNGSCYELANTISDDKDLSKIISTFKF